MDIHPCAKFQSSCNSFTGSLPPNNYVNYYALVTCTFFFLAIAPSSHSRINFNRLRLKCRVLTQGCAFWGFDDDPQFQVVKPSKKSTKGAWLGIFQPNWQIMKSHYLRRRRSDRRYMLNPGPAGRFPQILDLFQGLKIGLILHSRPSGVLEETKFAVLDVSLNNKR